MGLMSELAGMVGEAAQSELNKIEYRIKGMLVRYALLRTGYVLLLGALGMMLAALLLVLAPPLGWVPALFICGGIALVLCVGMLMIAFKQGRGCRM